MILATCANRVPMSVFGNCTPSAALPLTAASTAWDRLGNVHPAVQRLLRRLDQGHAAAETLDTIIISG